jgi:hypothetical protein
MPRLRRARDLRRFVGGGFCRTCGNARTFDGLLGSLLRVVAGSLDFGYLTHRSIYV